jgi:23S rRNA pseudouridine1911/1915/1917 synthase
MEEIDPLSALSGPFALRKVYEVEEVEGLPFFTPGPLAASPALSVLPLLEAILHRTHIVLVGGKQTIEVKLDPAHSGWRLDRALAAALPTLSRERLKALIRSGGLTSGGAALRDPATKVRGDEAFRLEVPDPEPAHNEPQDIPLSIVFEDPHLLVVDKPAGLVVHPAAGNRDGTLVNALLHHCGASLSGIGGVARPGIVHRIDKDTSGLLLVAKTDVAHEGLARQFAAHSIERRYLAIVAGVPTTGEGTVDAPLARSSADRKKIAIVEGSRGKRAVTHWKRLELLDCAALVECSLETGRTHQVRVHMASIGHPLLGDPVYGRSREHRDLLKSLGFHRQALHAARLGFTHPVTKHRLSFESGMPADMQELFNRLSV